VENEMIVVYNLMSADGNIISKS